MSGVPWGGSEELWWRTARRLQSAGHQICVNFKWWPEPAKQLQKLADDGAEIFYRDRPPIKDWWTWLRTLSQNLSPNKDLQNKWTEVARPDVVLVTLGYHPDRVLIADECHRQGIPYAINVQSASSFFFLHGDTLDQYRKWYRNAKRVYFVSAENQHKLETNLAIDLPNAEIIENPFNVDPQRQPIWPSTQNGYRLACVGRIHFQSKGQDLIVDVMRRDRWRNRPLEIVFYGKDQGNLRQLKDLIVRYNLGDRLKIAGFEEDMTEVWNQCHGLLLPSRYEGAALVIVEAMLSGRLAITTDTGRNAEFIRDGESGFIAPAATSDLLDEALERAWQVRDQWQTLGQLAAKRIRQCYSEDPVGAFADKLVQLPQI